MKRILIPLAAFSLLFAACGGHSAAPSADTDADSLLADKVTVDSTDSVEASEPTNFSTTLSSILQPTNAYRKLASTFHCLS